MSFLQPAFFFILALSLLVIVHEWGHYFVARRSGVRVLRFAIGFGPELLGWTSGDTRWSVCAIPFGGYVKFAGDSPGEESQQPDEFLVQPVGVRSAIVLAGPAMNYILAILIYATVIWVEGERVYPAPRVGDVVEETQAAALGMRPDDVIVAVGAETVENWADVDAQLSAVGAGEDYEIRVRRGEEVVPLRGRTADDVGLAGTHFGVVFFVEPVVGGVKRGSPAWNGGLREGDRIVSVDGESVDRWSALQESISRRPDRQVVLAFDRDGHILETAVTPDGEEVRTAAGETETIGRIGILQRIERERIGPLAALAGGFGETWRLTRGVLQLIPRLPVMIFDALFRGRDDGGLGGPVRMAQLFGEAARWGALSFATLLAFISTQLAIFNLLPIPVLDGGHLALYLVEVVTRRPPSLRVRLVLQQIGFAILVLLMLSVTVMDLGRVLG